MNMLITFNILGRRKVASRSLSLISCRIFSKCLVWRSLPIHRSFCVQSILRGSSISYGLLCTCIFCL